MSIGCVMLLSLLMAYSCSDDNPGPDFGPVQMPIQAMTGDLSLFQTVVNSVTYYEFGCQLRFHEPGRITKVCMMVPDNGSYRITLWKLWPEMVHTVVTVAADSGQLVYADIPDIEIQKDDEFTISLYSQDWYGWSKGGNSIYPVNEGNIQIVRYGFLANNSDTSPEYPEDFPDEVYRGLVDITFEPTL